MLLEGGKNEVLSQQETMICPRITCAKNCESMVRQYVDNVIFTTKRRENEKITYKAFWLRFAFQRLGPLVVGALRGHGSACTDGQMRPASIDVPG